RGEFNTETKNITMTGAIEGLMPDNTTIHTESFFFNNEKRLITTDDNIVITRSNFSMEGRGMIIDLAREKLSILGNVKALGRK
ncbi:MAG: LPS export ABC transporter periplasmic protein LptC, partial [Pseudomonadota bacterium]